MAKKVTHLYRIFRSPWRRQMPQIAKVRVVRETPMLYWIEYDKDDSIARRAFRDKTRMRKTEPGTYTTLLQALRFSASNEKKWLKWAKDDVRGSLVRVKWAEKEIAKCRKATAR